jgi:tRNA-dihydrouridine synthase A
MPKAQRMHAANSSTEPAAGPDRRISVAPMMDWTDRHCRYFLRQFSPRVLLYTEMIVAQAILKGLSPKENREVPPLDYARAWRVKAEFPRMTVVVNGGLRTVPQVALQLAHADGVMLGREAYHNPYLLPALHRAVYGDDFAMPEPAAVVGAMRRYAEREAAAGTPLRAVTRHMLGLFNGRAGARTWRRGLSEGVSRGGATPALLDDALRAALS